MRGTKAERNHSKALVHLLCQSISHDSCVIQKTTQVLLENCGSFPTKSANTLTLHYQDKHIHDLSMKEGSLFVMFRSSKPCSVSWYAFGGTIRKP